MNLHASTLVSVSETTPASAREVTKERPASMQIAILNVRMEESAYARGNADVLLDLGGNIVIK